MKKYIKLFILLFFISMRVIHATTIRETLVKGDGYDTILPNTFIIGVTKFSGDEVITASKAATAGANDAMIYALKHGTTKGYKPPIIYYYVDANVGWFQFDSNNSATPVTDSETLDKLSNLDIYYVNNVEKKLGVAYGANDVDISSLEDGIEYENGMFLVGATNDQFTITTNSGKEITFIKDENTSQFIQDTSSCYSFMNGIILDYDASCGGDVTIPSFINGEAVTGIAENAFNGKNLTEVVIPNSIVTIGNNAFFNNNDLTDVTMDGKYDSSDFTSLNENAFPANVSLNYRNELTNALRAMPDEYTIKVYSDFDIDDFNMNPVITNEVFKEINTEKYSFHIDQSELDKYYMIHYYTDGVLQSGNGECTDHLGTHFDLYFYIESNNSFNIYFEKRTNNCTRIINVHKTVRVNYEKTGSLLDKLSVDSAFSNFDMVDTDVTDNPLVTNRKDLEDFVDNNRLDYLFNSASGKIIEPKNDEEIGGSITTGSLYLFKNEILYKVVDNLSVLNLSNIYYPSISTSQFETSEALQNEMIRSFEEKTGINNYTILVLQQNKQVLEKVLGARVIYYMALFNKDTLEYWSIYLKSVTKDKYDEHGYTLESCFTIDNNILTGYDGTCGANVKIPDKINNQYIYKIGDEVFYDYGLESVVLPSKVTDIGYSAFYNNNLNEITLPDLVKNIDFNSFNSNKISSLVIPYNVISIGSDAFSNNELTSLTIPNTLESLGQSAFVGNKLTGDDAFIYEREYDYQAGRAVINNKRLNSYAGANREEVIIPSQVTEIGSNSFKGLGIKKVVIPYGVTHIAYYAFADNDLDSLSVPDTVDFVEWGAFYNNKFTGDNSFIYLRDKNGNIDKSVLVSYSYRVPDGYDYLSISRLEIPSTVKKIWSNAFSGGYSLRVDDLVVPYGVEEIGDNAFVNVTVKNKFTLPKSIQKLGTSLFSFRSNDNYFVYARNEDGTEDNSILMAFTYNDYLESIELPSNIKEVRENTFLGRSIANIIFNEGLEKIGESAFANMYLLSSVLMPSTLKTIDKFAFSGDYNLSELVLNEGLEKLGASSFYGNRLTNIDVPSTVKVVEDRAFYKDYYDVNEGNNMSITLKEGLEEIGDSAFASVGSLDEISIPSSVKKIGDNAFGYVLNVKIYGKSSFDDFDEYVYLQDYSDIIVEFINS